MKRGGLFFAAFLLISGILRLTGSSSPASRDKSLKSGPKSASTTESSTRIKSSYPAELAGPIEEFFTGQADESAQDANLSGTLELPESTLKIARDQDLQFVIALLPEPVHTHLGLFFDRGVSRP